MKGKNIILVGTGGIVGFISCGIIVVEKLLKNDKTREALKQVICDKVDWLLYGEEPRYRRPYRVNYLNCYDYHKASQYRKVDQDYIFANLQDAEKTLDAMRTIIEVYGFVSVTDVCDLCGIDNNDYLLHKYCWTDIDGCKPIRVKDGYKISLPKPKRIN